MFRVFPILCSASFIALASLLWSYVFIGKSKTDFLEQLIIRRGKDKTLKTFNISIVKNILTL